ncbi:energy coupling factor transporter S component ThiW [Desemzia sp. RIT804]|nr:energy coupling factor transporter S component ThiW [Desemzia sp. RIT 804]
MVQTALIIAIGYIGSSLIVIPLGFMRIAPLQHMMNLLTSALLGPGYSVLQAFGVSLLRNLTGTGSILAFPGSMIGALLSGVFFLHQRKIRSLIFGELLGTGIIGSLLSYPIARLFLSQKASLFAFLPGFFISSLVGTISGYLLLRHLIKRKKIYLVREEKNEEI